MTVQGTSDEANGLLAPERDLGYLYPPGLSDSPNRTRDASRPPGNPGWIRRTPAGAVCDLNTVDVAKTMIKAPPDNPQSSPHSYPRCTKPIS